MSSTLHGKKSKLEILPEYALTLNNKQYMQISEKCLNSSANLHAHGQRSWASMDILWTRREGSIIRIFLQTSFMNGPLVFTTLLQ